MPRTIIAISGFSSESGKTTLLCELLRALPGWEAIKLTRGHYRSCGRDPEACCVSHLLGAEPVIRSGREQTYTPGKDTGRYWDAGASDVHWVIATDSQVERGIRQALDRVQSDGVLVEGNSFLKFIDVDFTIVAAPAEGGPIKSSARRALAQADALFLLADGDGRAAHERFAQWRQDHGRFVGDLPIYTRQDLPQLIERIKTVMSDKDRG